MKLSIFTTMTNPAKRGDNYWDALQCYQELADEVVHVIGDDFSYDEYQGFLLLHESLMNKSKQVIRVWPEEFNWSFIGQQFQRGYEACTGDWVIRMDLDTIFHENDFDQIRYVLDHEPYAIAISFYKRQFILPDRCNVKSRLVVAVNKKEYGNRIRFDGGGDLCQPTFDGMYIKPSEALPVKIPMWNYECLLKTKEQLMDDKGRFARAWQRHFGEYKLGGPDDESAYEKWLGMVMGRIDKPQEYLAWGAHPKYVRETIRNLKPEQWGYDGLGNLERNRYAESRA